MTIVIAENFTKNILQNYLFSDVVQFSRDNLVILISETFYNSENLLKIFYKSNFVNVIYLHIESFENSKQFETFEVFPKFKFTYGTNFQKEIISDIKHRIIKVACNKHIPYSICFEKNNNIKGIGKNFHIISNFVKFLNGSIEFKIEKNRELSNFNVLKSFDLWTWIKVGTLKENLEMQPFNYEVFSSIFDTF